METKGKKRLQILEQQQAKLNEEQGQNRAAILSLKKELAAEEITELFSLTKKFAEQLTPSGAVYKLHEEIGDKLKILREYDPDYAGRLNSDDPTIQYFISYLFGASAFDGGLYRVLEKMVKNRRLAGNPLSEDIEEG